jgi:hypothetical protein
VDGVDRLEGNGLGRGSIAGLKNKVMADLVPLRIGEKLVRTLWKFKRAARAP